MGGGDYHDLLNDDFFTYLLGLVKAGQFDAVFAAPPCSTYSVARFFPTDHGSGPPPVRSRAHIDGLPDVPASNRRELRRANEITRRTTILLRAAHSTGADFVIENPADRGNPADHLLFQVAEHGPIWLDQHMIELARACSTESATFAQCRFGGASQKYTTLWFTAGMAPYLRPLRGML